jgi:cytochrome c oxidase subunit 2
MSHYMSHAHEPLRRSLVRGALLLLPALLTSGCVKAGISPKAHEVHNLFYIVLWLALPVFVFVEGMLVVSIVRFRKRRGDTAEPPQYGGRPGVLSAFFAGPLVIVVMLLTFGETTLGKVDKIDPHATEHVTMTGFQWAWQANYTHEGLVVAGQTNKPPMVMELPVDEPAQIRLESRDVIHEFYLPDLLFMRNAVPGHPNTFTFTPTRLGTFRGQCAQYCGLWHAQMRFVLKVVPRAEFTKWIHKEKAALKARAAKAACAPTGSKLTLTAHHIQWDKSCLGVLADKPFTITIVNKDGGIAHDFAIWESSSLKKQLFQTGKVTGPATKTFTVPALPPGKYYFQCNIHGPAMSGTLIVGTGSG